MTVVKRKGGSLSVRVKGTEFCMKGVQMMMMI
jgi:hypothetical protein